MDLGLTGKRALVMGGGRGIGRGIAQALAAEGASVALVSRNQAALDAAAAEIGRGAPASTIVGVAGDLGTAGSIETAFQDVVAKLGGVDILINNSGGPPPSGAAGIDPALWRKQFEAMVLSIIGLTDLALPAMRARKWGRVLTVASSGVIQPIPTIGMSNTLRSALVGWSKTLAGEVAGDGVTVNMLLPGRIHTERVEELDRVVADRQKKSVEQVAEEARGTIPVGRYGTIEEFGAVAAFLASTKAGYVTGSLIRIDGGAIRSI
ncbi:MAG TPA: SDR family oxidoreductase [Stellaceae bacterium]|nr:SDR family oxidoreductase [Stellaceae bacterium]